MRAIIQRAKGISADHKCDQRFCGIHEITSAELFALPVAGLIMMIIFALDDSNINRRNYARSMFCSMIVAAVLIAVLFATGFFSMLAIM